MTVRPAQFRIAILGTRGIPARYGGFETFAEELAVRWPGPASLSPYIVNKAPENSPPPFAVLAWFTSRLYAADR